MQDSQIRGYDKTSNLSHTNLKFDDKNYAPFGVFISAEKQHNLIPSLPEEQEYNFTPHALNGFYHKSNISPIN